MADIAMNLKLALKDSNDEKPEEANKSLKSERSALEKLVEFLAFELEELERGKSEFRRKPVKKMKFDSGKKPVVVEKIQRKYSHVGCPECIRRSRRINAIIFGRSDLEEDHQLEFEHICGSYELQKREVPENAVAPHGNSSTKADHGTVVQYSTLE